MKIHSDINTIPKSEKIISQRFPCFLEYGSSAYAFGLFVLRVLADAFFVAFPSSSTSSRTVGANSMSHIYGVEMVLL